MQQTRKPIIRLPCPTLLIHPHQTLLYTVPLEALILGLSQFASRTGPSASPSLCSTFCRTRIRRSGVRGWEYFFGHAEQLGDIVAELERHRAQILIVHDRDSSAQHFHRVKRLYDVFFADFLLWVLLVVVFDQVSDFDEAARCGLLSLCDAQEDDLGCERVDFTASLL